VNRYVERRILSVAERRLNASRAVVVNGPRQSGKTELLRVLHEKWGGSSFTLDRKDDLRVARTDPLGFIERQERTTFIDEVQRGGDPLLFAIKSVLDSSNATGQFVLAGSTRFLSEPRISESLAGRIRFVDLWPFSVGEVVGGKDRLVDLLFEKTDTLRDAASPLTGSSRIDTMDLVARGGFPEAVRLTREDDRFEFFEDYARTLAQRDISELINVRTGFEMFDLMRHLAARTSSVLNASTVANELLMSADSARRYIPLLETIYFHHLLPAWSRNLSTRQRHRPKIHLTDTGVAGALLGMNANRLANPMEPSSGAMLETFVVNELVKQSTWSKERVRCFHWRDRDNREVDLILETPDGRIAAIEVKASADVAEGDIRWLSYLRDMAGESFVNGVVIHCGNRTRPLGDRITSLPMSAIWDA
jgi:uncharacterized protein